MKHIHSSPDPLAVQALRGFLESKGIATCLIGEERPSMAGRVPPTECWVELHVYDDLREAEALALVKEYFEAQAAGETWTCPSCGEAIDAKFTDCWRCTAAPPAPRSNAAFGVVLIAASVLLLWYAAATLLRDAGYPAAWAALAAGAALFLKGFALYRSKPSA